MSLVFASWSAARPTPRAPAAGARAPRRPVRRLRPRLLRRPAPDPSSRHRNIAKAYLCFSPLHQGSFSFSLFIPISSATRPHMPRSSPPLSPDRDTKPLFSVKTTANNCQSFPMFSFSVFFSLSVIFFPLTPTFSPPPYRGAGPVHRKSRRSRSWRLLQGAGSPSSGTASWPPRTGLLPAEIRMANPNSKNGLIPIFSQPVVLKISLMLLLTLGRFEARIRFQHHESMG